MNWSKTIKIDDHRVLAFDPHSMTIALHNYNVFVWRRTFDESAAYDAVNDRCNLLYIGLYNRYAVDFNSKDKLHGQKSMLEFSTLCCLGFEQIVKPDWYAASKAIVFEPNEEIDTLVNLVCQFEESYTALAKSVIDNYNKELQS